MTRDESTRPSVVVDARALHATGIGRYLRELLARWFAEPPFSSIELLGDVGELTEFVSGHAPRLPVRVIAHSGATYSARAQCSWVGVRARGQVSARVGFFPHWDAPMAWMPRRSVVTVHDLIHFRVPDIFSPVRRAAARPMLRHVVRRASRIVCVGRTTASDLEAWMPRAAPKIVTIPNGVSDRFFRSQPGEPPVDGPYLVSVGNQKPHKNVERIVDVLARLRRDHRTLRLVVAGQCVGARSPVRERARELGIADAIVDLGAIDDAALHRCYAGAVALVFPSRYEGFGLPVVEAMASGTPVVASNAAAVAEIVGDAFPLRHPDDVDGMVVDVDALLREPRRREAAAAAGRRRAAEFSWARAADATANVLRAAAGGIA